MLGIHVYGGGIAINHHMEQQAKKAQKPISQIAALVNSGKVHWKWAFQNLIQGVSHSKLSWGAHYVKTDINSLLSKGYVESEKIYLRALRTAFK